MAILWENIRVVRFDVERKNLWTSIKPSVGGNAGKLSFVSNFKVTNPQTILAPCVLPFLSYKHGMQTQIGQACGKKLGIAYYGCSLPPG